MSLNDVKTALDEEESYAASWKPEAGDTLIGSVVRMNERTTEYGEYTIVTVKQEDGEQLAFHAYHTVAANALEDKDVHVGCDLAVRYEGKVQGESNAYHNYTVRAQDPDNLPF